MNATIESVTRSSNDWTTPAALRVLIKENLGYNARQISVRRRSSNQYLEIVVRDASVNLPAVEAFAAKLATWSIDNTDYCTGQSVHVETTREVNDLHAAPFIEEIKTAVKVILTPDNGTGTKLSNGKWLWKSDQGYWVTAELNGGKRGCYIWPFDVETGTDWAISALALQMARV